jgi:two-component system response regulator PilR (NtrC family)
LKKKHILIIDDDEQILFLLKAFVEMNDCTCEIENSAEKALALIHKNKYSLVILDIKLPDGDGLEILKHILTLSPNMPVIIITGGNDIEVAEECLKVGAVDYITKPFDLQYLRTSILVNSLVS